MRCPMKRTSLTTSLLVVVFIGLVGSGCTPLTTLGTLSGAAIGGGIGGGQGAALGAGAGLATGAALDYAIYGSDVFRSGEAQAQRRTESRERIRRDEILANLPCTLGGEGEVSYTANDKEVIKMKSQVTKGTPCPSPKPQVSAQPVPGSGYGRPSCQRGDWELRQTPFGARWTCSSTGE